MSLFVVISFSRVVPLAGRSYEKMSGVAAAGARLPVAVDMQVVACDWNQTTRTMPCLSVRFDDDVRAAESRLCPDESTSERKSSFEQGSPIMAEREAD